MGTMRITNEIDRKSDYRYTGKDLHYFPRCCLCTRYTPFLFYISSEASRRSVALMAHNVNFFFCVACLPKRGFDAESLYADGCIFTNESFLSMLKGFEYSNPYYEQYWNTCRIIITENTRVRGDYKKIMRSPQPKAAKLKKLINIFPSIHQLRYRRYDSVSEMYAAIQQKYEEISSNYNHVDGTFLDNYDMMVEATPRVERSTVGRINDAHVNITPSLSGPIENRFPSDILTARNISVSASDGSQPSSTASDGSQSSNTASIVISSESAIRATPLEMISESIESDFDLHPLSSSLSIQLTPAKLLENSSQHSSQVSSVGNVVPSRFHDSQEAGPSGLQPSVPKRRRVLMPPPMNPTPQEMQNRPRKTTRDRLPRLRGG